MFYVIDGKAINVEEVELITEYDAPIVETAHDQLLIITKNGHRYIVNIPPEFAGEAQRVEKYIKLLVEGINKDLISNRVRRLATL